MQIPTNQFFEGTKASKPAGLPFPPLNKHLYSGLNRYPQARVSWWALKPKSWRWCCSVKPHFTAFICWWRNFQFGRCWTPWFLWLLEVPKFCRLKSFLLVSPPGLVPTIGGPLQSIAVNHHVHHSLWYPHDINCRLVRFDSTCFNPFPCWLSIHYPLVN